MSKVNLRAAAVSHSLQNRSQRIAMRHRMAMAALALAGAATAFSAQAQQVDACKDILVYASRDLSNSVSYSDRRKGLFNQVCSNSSTGAGIDYKDVSVTLGLNYSSKEDYCNQERQATSDIVFANSNASIVVAASLQTYLECRKLADDGAVTDISLPTATAPTLFAVGVRQISRKTVRVESVTLNPDVVDCSWLAARKWEKAAALKTAVGSSLQNGDRWALSCVRKSQTDSLGNVTYPEVQLQVNTNLGSASFVLPEAGSASHSWAQSLKAELLQNVTKVNERVSNLKLKFASTGQLDMSAKQENKDCPQENAFAYGFQNSNLSNQSLDMWRCRTVELVIP